MNPTLTDRPEFKLAGYILKKDTNNVAAFQAPTFYDNDESILLVNGTRVETLLDEVVKPKKHGEYCFFYSSDYNKTFDYVMCADCDDFSQVPDDLFKITFLRLNTRYLQLRLLILKITEQRSLSEIHGSISLKNGFQIAIMYLMILSLILNIMIYDAIRIPTPLWKYTCQYKSIPTYHNATMSLPYDYPLANH